MGRTMIYDSFWMKKNEKYMKLSARMILQFEDESEVYISGAPSCWDDELNKRIDFSQYDVYYICGYVVPAMYVNRITDYKNKRCMTDDPNCLISKHYDIEIGRVYFRIVKNNSRNALSNSISSIIAFLPKERNLFVNEIFHEMYNAKFDFYSQGYKKLFMELMNKHERSIWIRYSHEIYEYLEIWTENTELFFNSEIVRNWNNKEFEPISHCTQYSFNP